MTVFAKSILVATAAAITVPSVTFAQASKPRVNNEKPEKSKGQVKRIHPHALKLILTGKKKEAAEYLEKTSAAILVLLVFLVLMNALAVYLRKRFENRW